MKRGDIVELTEGIGCYYHKGRLATFIEYDNGNKNMSAIVFSGEEDEYKKYGDCDVIPTNIIKIHK